MRFLMPRWRRASVTTKFSAAFGLFLLLIAFVSVLSVLTLREVGTQTDHTRDNAELQRLVLEIDSGLQKARLLQRDFFLQYHTVGVSAARETYALPAAEQVSRVISLSRELKRYAALKDQTELFGPSGTVELNLYVSAAERNADVFFEAVELVSRRAVPGTGLEANLDRTANALLALLITSDDPAGVAYFWEMEAFRQHYMATLRRPYFQSAFNVGNDLRLAVTQSSALQEHEQAEVLRLLDDYESVGEQILDLDVELSGKLHDLDLQAQTVDPITENLLAYATAEVEAAHSRIIRISRAAQHTALLAAVIAVLFAWLIALALNNSITRTIKRLTSTASALRAGNLAARTGILSGDELGHLAYTLDNMAAQLQETLDNEREARQEAETARQQEVYQRAELAKSEQRFRSLFEQSRDAILIVSHAGEPIALNAAALDLFGYTYQEIMKLHARDIYVDSERRSEFQRLIEQRGSVVNFEVRIMRRDGTERICLITASLIRLENGQIFGYQGILRDVTERHGIEQALERYVERLRILHLIDRSILEVEQPQASAEAALNRLRLLIPFNTASVGLFDFDHGEFVLLNSLDEVEIKFGTGSRVPYAQWPVDLLRQGTVWETKDLLETPIKDAVGEFLQAQGIRSIVSVPLIVRSELIGLLSMAMDMPNGFSPEYVEIARDVADEMAIAIQQARLLAAEQRRRQVAETLLGTAAVLNSTLDINQVLKQILTQISEVVEYDSTSLMQFDETKFLVIAHRGFIDESDLVGFTIPFTPDYPNWQVVNTKQPLALPDVQSEYPMFITAGYGDSQQTIRSWLGVPMLLRDQVIGMIALDRVTVRPFDADEIALAMAFASQAAAAMENARLYDQSQRHAAELEQHVVERTAELQQANTELQALTRLKDQFVSNVSHELRTPITSLKLRFHLLKKQPERLEKHLPVLQREADRLSAIIDDLLDLSRLQQDRMPVTPETIDLVHLAREYVHDRVPVAEERGLLLSFDESTTDPPSVMADRGLIGQALGIMVTNAMNYTPAGGRVIVSVVSGEQAGRPMVGLCVADTGIGVVPEERADLFEPFVRGKASQETGAPGTGLGLALLKQIVSKHGGTVAVESTGVPGEGSVFTAWLPVGE